VSKSRRSARRSHGSVQRWRRSSPPLSPPVRALAAQQHAARVTPRAATECERVRVGQCPSGVGQCPNRRQGDCTHPHTSPRRCTRRWHCAAALRRTHACSSGRLACSARAG
jgi:hypothetical protein